jgi:hypothetical protein
MIYDLRVRWDARHRNTQEPGKPLAVSKKPRLHGSDGDPKT